MCEGCIDSPAIAVTVSDSSRSLLCAWSADRPTVWASRLTHGQCDTWMAIVFCSVSTAAWHGGRASSDGAIEEVLSPSSARTHSSAESQMAGRSSRVRWPKQAGDTTYPPSGAGCPTAASKPADTSTMSGAKSRAIGITTVRNAARYSASPSGGLTPPDQATFTL
uniref:Uncharacterized protein n=1 Tax=Anopheles melas TaxID=34690 RepID=A0A182TNP1_9DIPT